GRPEEQDVAPRRERDAGRFLRERDAERVLDVALRLLEAADLVPGDVALMDEVRDRVRDLVLRLGCRRAARGLRARVLDLRARLAGRLDARRRRAGAERVRLGAAGDRLVLAHGLDRPRRGRVRPALVELGELLIE